MEEQLIVKRSDVDEYGLNVSYREKAAALKSCQILKYDEKMGKLMIVSPERDQTWTLLFSAKRDEVVLAKPNGSSERFKRVKK